MNSLAQIFNRFTRRSFEQVWFEGIRLTIKWLISVLEKLYIVFGILYVEVKRLIFLLNFVLKLHKSSSFGHFGNRERKEEKN